MKKTNKIFKMTKIKMFVVLMLLSMMFIIPVYAQDLPSLRVSLVNQNPDPVRPGEYVTVKLRVENIGQGDARNVKIEFNEQFPFSLDPGVSAAKNLGSIGSLQSGDLGVIVDFDVRVSRQAIEGNNRIYFSLSRDGSIPVTREFNIDVRTLDSGVSVRSVKSENFVPGKQGLLEINVENPSDSTISDISLELDLTSLDLPFAPSGSSATKKIRFIESNQMSTFRFNLMTFPDASIKAYQIPIKISYFDNSNQFVVKEDIIGVLVEAETDLRYLVDTSSFFSESTTGRITLNVVNRGLMGVKLFDVVLHETDDYKIVSNNEVYIGRIDSDDFERADFSIKRLNEKNPVELKFSFQYKDVNNNLYSEQVMIPAQFFPAPETKNNLIWIVLIVVLVIGYFGYKKFKKGRD